MDQDFIVYEPAVCKNKADLERFEASVRKLGSAGIKIERVVCRDISAISQESESYDLVMQEGLDALPIADYLGTIVCNGEYPDDQTLADYLDVPDGVLSVNKKGAPAQSNDLMPAFSCGTKGACIPKK